MLQETSNISGQSPEVTPIKIKELAQYWLSDIKNTMRPSSYARYSSYVNKYIIPYIGEIQAYTFDKKKLSVMLGNFYKGNYTDCVLSQYTVCLIEGIIRAMFRYGTMEHLVPEVYFGKAEYITKSKKDAIPLSVLETEQLVYVTEQQDFDIQLQVMLPLYAGLSLSELCGLKWEDIDFKTGKIYVHRHVMRIQKGNSFSGNLDGIQENVKRIDKKTKTSTTMAECELPKWNSREFLIPEKLYRILENIAHKKKVDKKSYVAAIDKKTRKGRKSYNEKMFPENKVPVPPDGRTLQYRLKAIAGQTWIENLNFQILRDTFAVMCLQAGGDVCSLAYVMGITVPIVCERYKHWIVNDYEFLNGIG